MATTHPTTATILFTDLVNSTELLQRVGDEAAQRVFETHHRLLRDAVAAHGGAEVKWTGDGLMVAFESATSAVRCAIAMQQAARRPAAGERLQIRVGLQVGEALRHDATDYFGKTVVVASRLCALADAGEILCSALLRALIADGSTFDFRDRGELALKGIAAPLAACDVLYEHDPLAMLTVTPFVGRGDVIDGLAEKLEQARAGHGSLVMLVGEPGIGKTRTAEEFAAYAGHKGATVLRGRCYDGEWAPPFSPFVEAFKEYAAATPPDKLAAALGADAGILARIVPALHEMLPGIAKPPPVAAEGERYRLLEAASNLFRNIASTGPVVLMLDDLHWADQATIAMLRHVARTAASEAVLLLGAYRDVEVDRQHPLAAALADLRRETTFERIPLRGLAAEEVGELLDVVAEQDVPRPLVDAIAADTNGNPFFIREVLLHLIEERKIFQEDGRWTSTLPIAEIGIPEGVREVIGRRLSRLSEGCNRMLTTASAMTGGFSWAELQAICEESEKALLDPLDEALRAQVLVEPVMGTYDFTHALIRHTLYDELSTPRRLRLHRRIAAALEQLYSENLDAHAPELAYHFCQASRRDGDIDKAVEYSRRAARRALAEYAHEDAIAQLERALELLGLSGRSMARLRAELLIDLAQAMKRAGQMVDARARFEQAAEIARDNDPDLLAPVAIGLDMIPDAAGVVDQYLVDLAETALRQCTGDDNPTRALLMGTLAAALAWSADTERRVSLSRDAIAIARRSGDRAVLMRVLNGHRNVIGGPAYTEERLLVAQEMARLAAELYDAEMRLQSGCWELVELIELGGLHTTQPIVATLVESAAELKQPQFFWYLSVFEAMRALSEGRFQEAEQQINEGLIRGQKLNAGLALQVFGMQLFAVRLLQGRVQEVEVAVKAMAAQYPTLSALRAVVSLMCIELGQDEQAREQFGILAKDDFSGIEVDSTWLMTHSLLAQVCAALGDQTRAALLYGRILPFADRNVLAGDAIISNGSAHRYLGNLAAIMRRWPEAEDHFEEGLQANRKMGERPFVALTAYEYASALLERKSPGDAERARILLDEGVELSRSIGMAAVLRRCEAMREQR